MASLFRNSRNILTRFSCVYRSAGTTVQPSGPSTNLSQASRMADGTDAAMKDAKQRATSADPIKPKPAGESTGVYVIHSFG
jgi:hypothetical protein